MVPLDVFDASLEEHMSTWLRKHGRVRYDHQLVLCEAATVSSRCLFRAEVTVSAKTMHCLAGLKPEAVCRAGSATAAMLQVLLSTPVDSNCQ